MTNYDQLFHEHMQDPQFAKAYYEARLERIISEMLETLKEQITRNEPKERLIQTIDSLQQQLHLTANDAEIHRTMVIS
jgi:hypothetical protein